MYSVIETPPRARSNLIGSSRIPKTPSKRYRLNRFQRNKFDTLTPSKSSFNLNANLYSTSSNIYQGNVGTDYLPIKSGSEFLFSNNTNNNEIYDAYWYHSVSNSSGIMFNQYMDPNEAIPYRQLDYSNFQYEFPFINSDQYFENMTFMSSQINHIETDCRFNGYLSKPKLVNSRKLKKLNRVSPKKPILKLTKSLNLIVESSKGTIEDATLFATEINKRTGLYGSKLPTISDEHQQVIVPITVTKEDRDNELRRLHLFIEDTSNQMDETTDENIRVGEDGYIESYTAIIRGQRFELLNQKDLSDRVDGNMKVLKWSETIRQG
ncbi:hypothetical protein Kpol_1044p30 [Vanderwaltozyma polyspora DSM 70294]|uniref:Uncharacterized protein n=1 Tax=Vanderwaltozyma polyspora (strain ATCC 22028 / DSM 70294 / BCRC 21397 / CBS 2163 / NBRC 10782 / NRRL Y-8283 / UCD 57-17) TaxID=436907 RepID=A7TP60_VANPO|nr:uncharacterized protein Kpol_1044p30 [Vanderwaltozyma polyspora DSM 70294]EDO15970.1 hypothetical protein Kpol_1044p30 [Vanderwaltozyma polyspora DSM 70294]